ncbi:hypothetical protein Tco_0425396 [Tanacetum coccineum]
MYHDLYLGGKALVERENVGLDLTKSNLYPSFIEDLTAKGMGLHVADSHTSNHHEDDFTPLETIRRFLGIFGSRSLSSSKGRPLSRRGGSESCEFPIKALYFFQVLGKFHIYDHLDLLRVCTDPYGVDDVSQELTFFYPKHTFGWVQLHVDSFTVLKYFNDVMN